jgi:hypothetical protein
MKHTKTFACPYCIENNKIFTLTNTGKAFYFYFYQRFLRSHHRYKNNIKDFLKSKVERDVTPPILSGKVFYDVALQHEDICSGFQYGKHNFFGFGVTYN